MSDPVVLAVKERVNLVADPALINPEAPRSAKVEVILKDGRTLNHFTPHAYGTKQNPMESESVNAKARALMEPVLGPSRTERIIERINDFAGRGQHPGVAAFPDFVGQVRFGLPVVAIV
jgi:2-methylcitrate dehydratase PrpD